MRVVRDETHSGKITEISNEYKRVIKLIPSSTQDRVRQVVQRVDSQSFSSGGYDTSILAEAIKTIFGDRSPMDIDVLVALVMYELWQSEEKTLEELLKKMKELNEAKQRRREQLERLKKKRMKEETTLPGSSLRKPSAKRLKPSPRLGTKVEEPVKEFDGEEAWDDLDKIAESTNLRLQMTMDRRSKYLSILSNIMKKTQNTEDTLIQNIK